VSLFYNIPEPRVYDTRGFFVAGCARAPTLLRPAAVWLRGESSVSHLAAPRGVRYFSGPKFLGARRRRAYHIIILLFHTPHMRRTHLAAALALLAIALGFSACKKDFSPDEPFPEEFFPSLIAGSQNGFVYAFDPATGGKRWEFSTRGANVEAVPYLKDRMLFIACEDGVVYKLDADRGVQMRRYELPAPVTASPVGDGDILYIGCADDTVYAYDIKADTLEWKYGAQGDIVSSPTVYDTIVVFGSLDGKVHAVDKVDGAPIWTFDPGTTVGFSSSPVVQKDIVYIGGLDNTMYALNRGDGTLRWSFATGGAIVSSPLAYGGNLIFGSFDNKVYCLDTASRQPRWIKTTGDRVVSSPFAFNQIIYVGSYDFHLYALNIIDGSERWKYKTDAIIKSSPLVTRAGLVYFGGYDQKIHALDTAKGAVRWIQNVNGLVETSPILDDRSGAGEYPTISGASRF